MAHIRLNTHPSQGGQAAPPVIWGARDPKIRGPVVGTVGDPARRNAIGVHSGSYGIYRALAIAAQELKALIEAKLAGQAAEVSSPAPTILPLLEALQQSVGAQSGKETAPPVKVSVGK